MKHVILIPVYNDWKSLNKLLIEIDKSLKDDSSFTTQILVINDLSTEKCNLNIKNFSSIKKIEIINLKKNLGSQKSIAVGLNYLKRQELKLEDRPGMSGFTMGLGFNFEKIRIDYAFVVYSRAGFNNLLSISTPLDKWRKQKKMRIITTPVF